MRIQFSFLLFVILYHHIKCDYTFKYFSDDFKKSMKEVKLFFEKTSSAVGGLFRKKNPEMCFRYRVEAKHREWEKGAAKYLSENNVTRRKERPKIFDSYKLSTPLLAQWHGRNIETHIIQTRDGYYLTAHRLTPKSNLRKQTVLLHHGLLGSSIDWILVGPGPSTVLPYILADAGYDVWLLNARGNYYSREHATLDESMPEYWNFSFDEMGLIDIPNVVDYIKKQQNVSLPMDFVGHSMGCTAFLVFLSSLPYYKKYFRVGVLIAPLAYMNHASGPLSVFSELPMDILKSMDDGGEFLPKRKVPSWLALKYCKGPTVICNNPFLFLTEMPDKKKWNVSFIARLLDHVPAGGSFNTILHYIQLTKSENFHRFNDESYEYDLQRINLPLAFISSSDDYLATAQDVRKMYYLVQNPIDHFLMKDKNVSHTDFLWDKTISTIVFHKIMKYLERGLNWNMIDHNHLLGYKHVVRNKLKSLTLIHNGVLT